MIDGWITDVFMVAGIGKCGLFCNRDYEELEEMELILMLRLSCQIF